jgi:hypothetical protein
MRDVEEFLSELKRLKQSKSQVPGGVVAT